MKYETKVGDDFPLAAKVIDAKTRQITEKTRSAIALALVLSSIAALVGAAAFGLWTGRFDLLRTVWDVVAAPLGGITMYYFRGANPNDKTDN